MKESFRRDLTALLNQYSQENGSDTPDFVLAEYLQDCLTNFDKATIARDEWYGQPKGQRFAEATGTSKEIQP